MGLRRVGGIGGIRGGVLVCSAAAAFVAPAAGAARPAAAVPQDLLAQAQASPDQLFHVIVQGGRGDSSDAVAGTVAAENGKAERRFRSLGGVAAAVTGSE